MYMYSWIIRELERADAQYSWTRAELPGKPRAQGEPVSNQTRHKKKGQ